MYKNLTVVPLLISYYLSHYHIIYVKNYNYLLGSHSYLWVAYIINDFVILNLPSKLYLLCFHIMKLKFSGSIVLINWIFVLLGGEPVPGIPYIFLYGNPCKGKHGRDTSNLAVSRPHGSQKGHKKWIKDIYLYVMMFCLCLVRCEYVQHTFLTMRAYT